jgi:tetratricopeptide (TPR) repeat protein
LDIEKKPLYILLHEAVLFFLEKYSQALSLLESESDGKRHFQKRAQLIFSLRLRAFCHYRLARYEKASEQFKKVYFTLEEPEVLTPPRQEHTGTYNELGRVQKAPRTENMSEIRVQNDAIRDYYHLKEVSIEAGKGTLFIRGDTSFSTRLLNLEGLSPKTWAALDVGFSLVRGRLYSEAKAFFQEVHERHPEVLGLKRVIEMIDEKTQKDAAGAKQKEGLRGAEKSTKKILEKKARSFELWEYVEAWEKTVVRPYHMVHAAGYTARVQLKPSLLMMKDGRFPWQL